MLTREVRPDHLSPRTWKNRVSNVKTFIQLTTTRLIVAQWDGKSAPAWSSAWLPARTPAAPGEAQGDAWAAVLSAATEPLERAVTALGLKGTRATICVRTPGESFIASLKPAEAAQIDDEEHARVALAEHAEFPVMDNPFAFEMLGAGKPGSPGRAVIASADSDLRITETLAWATRGGLGPSVVVSSRSLAALLTARHALSGDGAAPRAALWIGESASMLAVAANGQFKLLRPISIGLDALVEPLTRPIRRTSSEPDAAPTPPVTLDRPAAWNMLLKHGIPSFQAVLDEKLGITGQAVLPLLAPVLQTLAVELKQTMRFGLAESERATVPVDLGGPGGSIEGLAAVLARQCGLNVRHAPTLGAALDPAKAVSPGTPATAVAWAAPGLDTLLLVPRVQLAAKVTRRARVAVAVGVGIAAAGVAWSWLATTQELAQQRSILAGLGQRALSAEEQAKTAELLQIAQAALRDARGQLSTHMSPVVDTATLLDSLVAAMPDSARIARLSLTTLNGKPALLLTGWMPDIDGSDFPATLRTLTDRLAALPMVASVRLGPTGRSRERGEPAQRFELTLALVGLPAEWLARRELPATTTTPALAPGAAGAANPASASASASQGSHP